MQERDLVIHKLEGYLWDSTEKRGSFGFQARYQSASREKRMRQDKSVTLDTSNSYESRRFERARRVVISSQAA